MQRDAVQGQRWRITNADTGKAAKGVYLPDEMAAVLKLPKDTDVTPQTVVPGEGHCGAEGSGRGAHDSASTERGQTARKP